LLDSVDWAFLEAEDTTDNEGATRCNILEVAASYVQVKLSQFKSYIRNPKSYTTTTKKPYPNPTNID
jgi:hypothetical protein